MAGEWIKIRTNLASDPRVLSMADALQVHEGQVIGACVILWSYADEHSTNGRLDGVSLSRVDRMTGLTGFGEAMRKVNWLDVDADGNVRLTRFGDHNGQTAKTRALTARRVANFKKRRGNDGTNGGGNGPGNAQGNAGRVTNPLPRAEQTDRKSEKREPGQSDQDLRAKRPTDAELRSAGPACLAACQTAREALVAVGVEDPTLGLLIAAKALTATEVKREWDSIDSKAKSGRLLYPAGVLIARLAKRHGVNTKAGKLRIVGDLGRLLRDPKGASGALAEIERARQQDRERRARGM